MSSQPNSLLRHHPLLTSWLVRVCTASGSQMLTVAIGWHIYELTSNVLDLGLIGLVGFLPRVLFMSHTRHVTDRYDRCRITALHQIGQVLVVVTLVFSTASGEIAHNMIFALVFAPGTVRAFEVPTIQALLPSLAPVGPLPHAVVASVSATQAATITVPALGGLLYVFGASWVHVPTAALYVLAYVPMFNLLVHNQPLIQGKVTLDSLLTGVHFIRSRPGISGATSLDLFAMPLGGTTVLLSVLVEGILFTRPRDPGLLRSAPVVGVLVMSFWLAHFSIGRSVGRIMLLSMGILDLATIVFGPSKSSWLSPGMLVVLGAMDTVSMVVRDASVQPETLDETCGRVSTANDLFIGASDQLGEFESGLVTHWFGTVSTVVLSGTGASVVIGVWMKLFPSLT